MSLQSIGNSLSLQQIMQMLQQQSVTTADPEAAAADGAGTSDPAGQNLPADQAQAEDTAGQAPQVTSAKPTLDPSTIKTLLQIQEAQTQANDDVLIFGGNGSSSGDPLLDALSGNSNSAGQGAGQDQDPLTSLINQMTQQPAAPTSTSAAPMPDLSQLDPAQLQSILATMTGSAASGDAIAGLTQSIMSMLGGDGADAPDTPPDIQVASSDGIAPVAAAEE